MSLDCEKSLISKLIETKDYATVDSYRIRTSFFTGDNKRVYAYIIKQLQKVGEIPTVRVIESKFPDYDLITYMGEKGREVVGTEESLNFWCNELIAKVKHNRLVDIVEQAAEDLDGENADKAFEILRSSVASLDDDITEKTIVLVNETAEQRKELYLRKTRTGGLLGISTGSHYLDFITKGFVNGTLTTIAARTGAGKTFLEVLLGCHAVLQGCSVLQMVTEMSTELMQDRFDAMMFAQLHKDRFSYKDLKSGKLTPKQKKDYFYFLDEELPELEPYWIETATGVMALEQKIRQLNPDIVFIDGVYLMEDDQNARDDWLRVAHITRDLKKLAKRLDKPIVINTALDEKASSKSMPKLADIKYAQSIEQDSDSVWFLIRNETLINDREAEIYVAKNREGENGKVTFNWDFSDMDFSEIFTDVSLDNDTSVSNTQENTLDMETLD